MIKVKGDKAQMVKENDSISWRLFHWPVECDKHREVEERLASKFIADNQILVIFC